MNKVKKNLDLACGIIAIVLGVLFAIPAVKWIIVAFQYLSSGYPIITLLLQIVALALVIIILVNGIKTVIKPGLASKKANIVTIIVAAALLILNIVGYVPALAAFLGILFYPMVICIIGFKVAQLCIK